MTAPAAARAPRLLGRRWLLRVGRHRLSSYVAMLYLGCVAGVLAGVAVAAAEGLPETRSALAMIVLLVPALVGARLWFVLQHLDVFRADPSRIWRRADGGSALYGGLVLSVVVSIALLPLAGLPFWAFWDAGSLTMLVGLVFTRFGCLMNGCCAGRVTSSRFGVLLPNDRGEWRRRYPTPLLEAGWAAVVLAGALAARPGLTTSGALFAAVVAAYAAGRLLLERSRESVTTERAVWVNAAFAATLLLAAGAVFASGSLS